MDCLSSVRVYFQTEESESQISHVSALLLFMH